MKKYLKLLSGLSFAALFVMTGCNNDDDPIPEDPAPEAKVFTVTMNSNNLTPSITGDVSTSDGTAKLRLDVLHTTDLDEIYIMKSEDNGELKPFIPTNNVITSDGSKTFTKGTVTSESLKLPGTTRNFVVDIPVNVRSTPAAVTDVYYIWITNGDGAFTKPTKNTVLGPAVVTLKYSSSASATSFSTATVNLGDQTAVPGSLLVTSGQIAALLTADYNDAPGSADISLSALNQAGTVKTNGSQTVYFVSPDIRDDLGFVNEPTNPAPNVTLIETYAGAAAFDNVTAANLASLTFSGAKSVQIGTNGVYQFKTSRGKQGLIRVNSITSETDADAGKVANVTVKVLN